jgi:tRNA pseudouridine38-40 synthase
MARYKLIIAYDGTDFAGFQRQNRARTVQAVLETALRQVGWHGKAILAAGRTDAGVHASGQVVAFDFDWQHEPDTLLRALNAHLPADVAVRQAASVMGNFHPRYGALARCYCYRLFWDAVRQPLRERYAWRVWPIPDLELLRDCAELLAGRHDFIAFGSPPKMGGSTIRTMHMLDWSEDGGNGLQFVIVGDAFLYHMVRRLVAYQVAVAQGKLTLAELSRLFEPPALPPAIPLAPPGGLCLEEVFYQSPPGE